MIPLKTGPSHTTIMSCWTHIARSSGYFAETRLSYKAEPNAMTIQVNLNPETEARLIEEARAQGLPLEKLAERLLKEALASSPSPEGALTVEEFHKMLGAMAEGSEKLPNLPTESFSRESFYEDRVDGRDTVPRR